MQEVKIILVTEIDGLEPNDNFIMKVPETGKTYLGNGTDVPEQIMTDNTTNFRNLYLYGNN